MQVILCHETVQENAYIPKQHSIKTTLNVKKNLGGIIEKKQINLMYYTNHR